MRRDKGRMRKQGGRGRLKAWIKTDDNRVMCDELAR